MKKVFISLVILAGLLPMWSCSLKEDPNGYVSPYSFFSSKAQCRAAVNGCYNPLNYIHNLKYLIALEGATDLGATNNSAQPDSKFEINPANPGAAVIVWRQSWRGVGYCLSTLAGIDRSTKLTESEKTPYIAETRVLLAYYYYVLTSFFGDVPFYETYIETDEDMYLVGRLPRVSATQIRQTLIEELKHWTPLLPQVRTCDQENHYNYCGAAMGWMVMAKMAAWDKDWDTVLMACGHLEDIYGDLNQYPYSDVCFRNKNTAESIFEINHEFQEGGIDYVTGEGLPCGTILLPYPKTNGEAIFDGVTIPELGKDTYCYQPIRPTKYMKDNVAPAGVGDIRREYNISTGWNGVKFNGSRSWMGQKFWCFGMLRNNDSNNYKIFRYADAILLQAEAWCEKGDFAKSVAYLNKVRERAQITLYSFVSEVKLRGEIRDERARELFGEFNRKYDLVRWGIWYDQVSEFNTYGAAVKNIRPCHQFYPIPDVQCSRTGRVLSNPEYDKYNLSN